MLPASVSKPLWRRRVSPPWLLLEPLPPLQGLPLCLDLLCFPLAGCVPQVLEAMASGLPVVCTATAGVSSFATANVDCLMAPAGQPAELAQRVLSVLEDAPLAARLAAAARQTAQRYTPARVTEQLERVLYSLTACRQELMALRLQALPDSQLAAAAAVKACAGAAAAHKAALKARQLREAAALGAAGLSEGQGRLGAQPDLPADAAAQQAAAAARQSLEQQQRAQQMQQQAQQQQRAQQTQQQAQQQQQQREEEQQQVQQRQQAQQATEQERRALGSRTPALQPDAGQPPSGASLPASASSQSLAGSSCSAGTQERFAREGAPAQA